MTVNQLHIGAGYLEIGDEAFDSRYRYIRRVANAADKTINMCSGPSFAILVNNLPNNEKQVGWSWTCNTVVVATKGLKPPTAFNTGVPATL